MNISEQRTFLAIDVGNIRTKIGLFEWSDTNSSPAKLPNLLDSVAYAVDDDIPWGDLEEWNQKFAPIQGGIIAGSNPKRLTPILSSWPKWNTIELTTIHNREQLAIEIDVIHPEKLGMDRLLNAVAVNTFRNKNQPALIVDSGTATTIDQVDKNGTFVGGAILPGFELSARALNRYTALLPLINMKEMIGKQPNVLGKETRAAVCSGLHWGQIGAVKEILSRMEKTLDEKPLICLTGGAAPLLEPELPNTTEFIPHLGLSGLAIVGMSLSNED